MHQSGLCSLHVSPPKHAGLRYLLFLLFPGIVACGSVPLTLVGPKGPLVAVAGQDLVLPCSFVPGDTQDLSVVWYRIKSNTQTHIHVHSDGADHNDDQSPDYRGRTSLFLDKISKGNVSLKLSGVRLSDAGKYQCTVDVGNWNHDNADMEVKVKVIGTEPTIFTDRRGRTQLSLRCVSSGWSPEPLIDWLDAEGRSLPAEPTESHREANGTFRVERRLLVEWKKNNSSNGSIFHCRVTLGDVVRATQRNISGLPADDEAEEELLSSGVEVKMIVAVCIGLVAMVILLVVLTVVLWMRINGRLEDRRADIWIVRLRLRNARSASGEITTAPVKTA